ncbi:MAG: AAA family ATPase [Candidatus Dependentiae bacterium]|nr:AAA family ATPase [Candidatus Dependentiae bacterium]
MNNKPKQLGLNCSIFEHFVTEGRIYVDKTKIIYDLITALDKKHFYFVSRPRRFGKSLFISTLKEIFAGKKELFAEYWIGKNSSYDWRKHPVIHLDFGGIENATAQEFKHNLCLALQKIARQYDCAKLEAISPGSMLNELVEQLEKRAKVVLLVDEYDKPLVDHVDNVSLAEENRKILNSFYTTVKSLESSWRAIFITGVSKFARTSVFSGLNNLKELTFDPVAAELFGYTYAELVTYFLPRIDDLALHLGKTRQETLDSMKIWYDGYRFCDDMQKPQMYSPLSVVASIDNKRLSNYWFNTGSPGFLIALLRLKGISLELRQVIKVSNKSLNAIDISNIPLFALLFQTGYLTIVDYDAQTEVFTLDYPNREVRESFKDYLMQAFAYATPELIEDELSRMRNALVSKDFEQFCNAVKALFASIPHNLHIAREAYYHSLFHFMFDMLSMRPKSEEATRYGESDLVLESADAVIVFEFKYNKSAQEALNQIIEKKYHEKYMYKNKEIVLVGININFKRGAHSSAATVSQQGQLELEWLEKRL